jgi:hypothetical protein
MVTLSLFFTPTTMSEQACSTSLPLEIITLIITCVHEGEDKRKTDYRRNFFKLDTRPRSMNRLFRVNRRLWEMCRPLVWQVSGICVAS